MQGITASKHSAPAQTPIDLEAARLSERQIMTRAGVAALCLIGATAGLYVVVWSASVETYTLLEWLRALFPWRIVGMIFGSGTAYIGISFAWRIRERTLEAMIAHDERVEEWHQAALESWRSANGQVVNESITEWTLTVNDPNAIIRALLYIYMSDDPTPWSVRKLSKDPLYVNVDHKMYRIGEMSQQTAEQFGSILAQAQVIQGRSQKSAGRLVEPDIIEAFKRVMRVVR